MKQGEAWVNEVEQMGSRNGIEHIRTDRKKIKTGSVMSEISKDVTFHGICKYVILEIFKEHFT